MIATLTRIVTDPLWVIFLVMTLAVFGFAAAFRKQDPNAVTMAGVILILWAIEVVAKAAFGESFRNFLPVTDAAGAVVAYRLGLKKPSDWLRAVYISCVIACGLHVFQQWGSASGALTRREYIVLLNALFVVRLACIMTPGVSYVGKVVGAHLSSVGNRSTLAMSRKASSQWER